MSTVKISDLPEISHLNLDTTQTIIPVVDVQDNITGKLTVKNLAEGLFHNDSLKVGENEILFSNTVAQFSGNGTPFLQVNLQNFDSNSSGDYVVTADIGTNANNFIDVGINGSTFTDPTYSAMQPLDGYLYVMGSLGDSTNGNLVIGTASSGANVVVAPGGTTTENVVAHFTKNGLVFQNSATLEFTDGSIQTVAAAPTNYTQSAFDAANTAAANTVIIQGVNVTQNTNITAVNNYAAGAYAVANTNATNISIIQGVNTTQNTNITTANNHAWAAFDKANTSLQNTSTIIVNQNLNVPNLLSVNAAANITGTLNVTGSVQMNATVFLTNSTFTSTQSALTISATPTVLPPANDGYFVHISGKQNVACRIVSDSFGANANTYPVFVGRAARGNVSYPSAVQTNDILARFTGNGYGSTNYGSLGSARIDMVASENWTDSSRGSIIQFWNSPTGSNTLINIATFNASNAVFSGHVEPQKGFIFTPNVYPNAQTAITIDISNNSVVRAQTSSALATTLTNFIPGKLVDAWITNIAGSTQTFTHGVSAINSTTGSTTYNIPGGSTIYVRYWCMDGTLSNTFAAITHA